MLLETTTGPPCVTENGVIENIPGWVRTGPRDGSKLPPFALKRRFQNHEFRTVSWPIALKLPARSVTLTWWRSYFEMKRSTISLQYSLLDYIELLVLLQDG